MTKEAIRIARFAGRLRRAVWALSLLIAGATATAILLPVPAGRNGAFLSYDGLPRAWAIPIAALAVGLTLAGLFELGRMLRLVEADAAFSPRATRHLKRFAAMLMAAVLAAILLPAAGRFMTQGGLTLSMDSSDALLLLVSIVFFLISRLLDAAAAYQEDSRSIV